jgi:toxin ParE1/3/4
MSRLRLSDHAKTDLGDAWLHIALDNSEAADRTLAALLERMDLLAQSPGLGRRRDELRPGLHSFPVGAYVIFYRKARRGIEIVRVLSGSRDLPSLF